MPADELTDSALELSPESFARFAKFITGHLGIKMSDAKIPMLQSRLMRRLRELQLNSLDEYRRYLFEGPDTENEHVHFIDAVTTNKTDFFREPQHFDYLVNTILPGVLASERNRAAVRFRLWCAGCSSGEEPYTQAMVLSDFAAKHPGFDYGILATDISTRVLTHARAGIYDVSRIEPVPEAFRQSYLLRSKDKTKHVVRIVPHLREKISFHRLNFMDNEYRVKDMFDAIFFRNVMIYFDKPTQEAVIRKLCRHLKTGGYLFVGHSESLAGLDVPVTPLGSAVFRKVL